MKNNYADNVWSYFEENIYENKDNLSGYDLDMDKLEEFKEFVTDNADTVLDASGLLGDYKDIDDAENELNKLVNLMWQGADKAQDKLMQGEFIC
jgi:hypothetical protein